MAAQQSALNQRNQLRFKVVVIPSSSSAFVLLAIQVAPAQLSAKTQAKCRRPDSAQLNSSRPHEGQENFRNFAKNKQSSGREESGERRAAAFQCEFMSLHQQFNDRTGAKTSLVAESG